MRSPLQPVHYRIYVYQNAAPPLGQATPTSLCPGGRNAPATLRGSLAQVTCTSCWKFIHELGLDRAGL